MVLSLTSTLSLFVLIALSTVIFFAAKRFKLPYTVLLVLVGVLLVPIVNLPYLSVVFGFLNDLVLTPELLFYIFLPVLIFESGFNMNIRKMLDNAWAISLLSVVGLFVSALVIASLLYVLLPLIGINIPFIIALLFGAVISPTDPVAVLSLFKEFKVPKRLGMIFEGESLFNDGTAVALFFVLLGVATFGFQGAETVAKGVADFVIMIMSGIVIGLFMAALITRALRLTRSNEFVTVTLLIISAHLVFITTEVINHLGYFHVSSIIATSVASLFMGNYSRNILAPKVDEYLSKLIEHMAFIVNSLVFLLAGLLFASSGVDFKDLWLPILIGVLVVAFARMVSVYCVVLPLNMSGVEEKIPLSWQKLMSWASLRGALSIIIVLIIPENFTIEGWTYDYSPRDFLLALTIGCILATLFIKAPLIGPMMRRYHIEDHNPLAVVQKSDLGIYFLLTERSRLQEHLKKGFISFEHYVRLVAQLNHKIVAAETERTSLIERYGANVFVQSLHFIMVRVELTALKRLYVNGEVNENVYRKIHGKLMLQLEKIEDAQHNDINPQLDIDSRDVFDRLVNFSRRTFFNASNELGREEKLEYYRAQMIMARKAVMTVENMQGSFEKPIFMSNVCEDVLERYLRYKEQSSAKMDALLALHREDLEPHLIRLAECSLDASGSVALGYLHENGLISEADEDEIRQRFTIG